MWVAVAGEVPGMGFRAQIGFVSAVVIPATFAAIWLAVPLARWRWVFVAGLAVGGGAAACHVLDLDALFEVTKLCSYALLGFGMMRVFREPAWIVLVALIGPWVDALSVWRGPTDRIVSEEPGLVEGIAVGLPSAGEASFAFIGPPDVLFFAVFLGAAARWELRTGWTWLAMTAGLSLTLILAAAFDVDGLPALPAVCFGFLLPNADLLWRRWRTGRLRFS